LGAHWRGFIWFCHGLLLEEKRFKSYPLGLTYARTKRTI
jgi:hypothetical protein